MGDILGPCAFAALMGLSRIFYGLRREAVKLERTLMLSGAACLASYLITVFSPHPLLSLGGCALCGLSVGILWPGTFSLAARSFPRGGTAMFAVLALAGDAGCAAGPGLVGMIMQGGSLTRGLLAAVVFPALLMGSIALFAARDKPRRHRRPIDTRRKTG
jgi:MFS family permease